MSMDGLNQSLLDAFPGKVVRKDLVHRIKKGTNVPTFVLEFLLARYCASDAEDEIQAGLDAVLSTLQDNYVRPDEANAAQSRVATRGKHRFIDKVTVDYNEKEKKHWASLQNFGSSRVAIAERFYRDCDRLLEGGIWAEITIAHNAVDEEDFAFYVEDLRPIQLSRFAFDGYCESRNSSLETTGLMSYSARSVLSPLPLVHARSSTLWHALPRSSNQILTSLSSAPEAQGNRTFTASFHHTQLSLVVAKQRSQHCSTTMPDDA